MDEIFFLMEVNKYKGIIYHPYNHVTSLSLQNFKQMYLLGGTSLSDSDSVSDESSAAGYNRQNLINKEEETG